MAVCSISPPPVAMIHRGAGKSHTTAAGSSSRSVDWAAVRFHPSRTAMHIAFDSIHSGSTGGEQDPTRSLVPLSNPFQPLSQEMAMGLVLQAASGKGWTTDSGLEGPAFTSKENSSLSEENQWPLLSKSPRRRMRVAFTCNVCGARTMRAINPHAYTDGTVFVQCKGCNVFHKLVDNLNLFYEWDGRLYKSNTKSIPPTGKFYRFLHTDDEAPPSQEDF
ncbi:uncharacterized protein LOC112348029 [Selaginella moellendorffii]|uniref:uncharacterized protein LOC112348029 n=1 Tax=Selaginella moellendorffii TaxID=88036 RepID=UPI000D1CE12A|nr:uncharacterized protein LOC112348029 [Selaginella moellendorffii]|eukprot:XP_024535690.1 uncharacterized protein LOC112348029 [Selaginella moellendorffii]